MGTYFVIDAMAYGLSEACMLSVFRFWIRSNKANGVNLFNGRYWTYNSNKALRELFPFWSEDQIFRIIKSLKTQGAIYVGKFNGNKFDTTNWYTIADDSSKSKFWTSEDDFKTGIIDKIPDAEEVE